MSGAPDFWVLFDTATKADYYSDVHQVLAQPAETLMRYDYRDVYLTDAALRAAAEPKTNPRPVLVVYTQWTRYARDGATPHDDTPWAEMACQALRLGVMKATWVEGDNHYFQFQLGDYPAAEPADLAPIVDTLAQSNATPFKKWVALSHEADALKSLRTAQPAAEWARIVDRLGSPPFQFQGDTFWRLDRPTRSRRRAGKALKSTYTRAHSSDDALAHSWIVPEAAEFAIDVTMREPRYPADGAPDPEIQIVAAPDGPIHDPSPGSVSLRRNAATSIALESKYAAKVDRKRGPVQVHSEHTLLGAGSNGLGLEFVLRLARWKQFLGAALIVMGVAAVPATAVAAKVTTSSANVPIAIAGVVLAALTSALGALLYTGRLPVKT